MAEPVVSVVIPTFARPQLLRECLDALCRQTLPRDRFEVIVVDDGGPAALDGILAAFGERLALRGVRQAHRGPAAARNRGAVEATAALVAFIDDDCRPLPDWLERLVVAEHERPGALVGGTTVNGLPGQAFAATSQLIVDLVYEHFNADSARAYFLASNNILCARERLLDLGGFDTSYRRAGAEDRDFCDRWRAAGREIVWRPEARIEHRHAQTLWQFIDLHYRYGRGAYLYQAKRRFRGTGTMREDLEFHRSLPGLVWRRLGRPLGLVRSAEVAVALVLWQAANAVGFFVESVAARGGRSPLPTPGGG